MLVVSPHLDDAVLSCGRLLAGRPGSVVATVFAGVPSRPDQCTDWTADAASPAPPKRWPSAAKKIVRH